MGLKGERSPARPPLDPVECLVCLIHGRLQQVSGSLRMEADVLAYAAGLVASWPSRTEVFVSSYEYVERLIGVRDYYRSRKEELNKAALSSLPQIRIPETLPEALEFMAAANGIDISMPGYKPGFARLVKGLGEKPHYRGVARESLLDLEGASRLVVVLDNAGEAVFDMAASSKLSSRYGIELVFVARSEPYEIDVTSSEAEELAGRLGLDARIIATGSRLPVFHPKALPESRRLVSDPSSIVLVKGIANLEAYMDFHEDFAGSRLLFLLRAKCNPLSRFFEVSMADPIIASASYVKERLKNWREGVLRG